MRCSLNLLRRNKKNPDNPIAIGSGQAATKNFKNIGRTLERTNENHVNVTGQNQKPDSSWQIFKIMAEFVDGFEALAKIGPCCCIFGSARVRPGNRYYDLAVDIGKRLAEEGFGVISGGGPGIMEASNKGAQFGDGKSVGLNIELPFEQYSNSFIDKEHSMNFDYFFVRKVMFVKYSQAFIMMPGGFGTMDEFFSVLHIDTNRKNVAGSIDTGWQ